MKGKATGKKTGNKIGYGILFVAACFIAMYVLTEFHDDVLMVAISAVMLLISAFLFLNAVFSDKAKQLASLEAEEEEPIAVLNSGDGEFRLKIAKHMKEMESTQKELIDVLKNQNTLIKGQIENLAHEIYMLSEKQANQAKSIIKFNKENARQLAISERETLEYIMLELKKAIEDNGVPVSEREVSAAQPVAEAALADEPALKELMAATSVFEDVEEAELFTVSDFAADDEFVMPEQPLVEEEATPEETELPELSEDIDLSALFEEAASEVSEEELPADFPIELLTEESPAEEEPTEEIVEEATIEEAEPAPAADPLAGLSSDPNAMMSPEDIAKLLEAMGQ